MSIIGAMPRTIPLDSLLLGPFLRGLALVLLDYIGRGIDSLFVLIQLGCALFLCIFDRYLSFLTGTEHAVGSLVCYSRSH